MNDYQRYKQTISNDFNNVDQSTIDALGDAYTKTPAPATSRSDWNLDDVLNNVKIFANNAVKEAGDWFDNLKQDYQNLSQYAGDKDNGLLVGFGDVGDPASPNAAYEAPEQSEINPEVFNKEWKVYKDIQTPLNVLAFSHIPYVSAAAGAIAAPGMISDAINMLDSNLQDAGVNIQQDADSPVGYSASISANASPFGALSAVGKTTEDIAGSIFSPAINAVVDPMGTLRKIRDDPSYALDVGMSASIGYGGVKGIKNNTYDAWQAGKQSAKATDDLRNMNNEDYINQVKKNNPETYANMSDTDIIAERESNIPYNDPAMYNMYGDSKGDMASDEELYGNSNPYAAGDEGIQEAINESGYAPQQGDNSNSTGSTSYSGNQQIDDAINSASQQTGVPPNILNALIKNESSYRPDVVSETGAIGLTQLEPATAEELGVNPHDINQNVLGGAMYIKQMYDKTGNWHDAFVAYNEGGGAWDAGTRLSQSEAYADKVMADAGNAEAPTEGNGEASTYNLPTQGGDIDEQVSNLKPEFRDALPEIGGILNDMGLAEGSEISSAARSVEHNREVNGAPNSYHTRGDAVDIVLPDGTTAEEATAVLQKFKDTGAFTEVLFHDAGSGYHLHLGGYKGGLGRANRRAPNSVSAAEAAMAEAADEPLNQPAMEDKNIPLNSSDEANPDTVNNPNIKNDNQNITLEIQDAIKNAIAEATGNDDIANQRAVDDTRFDAVQQAIEAAKNGDYDTALNIAKSSGDEAATQIFQDLKDKENINTDKSISADIKDTVNNLTNNYTNPIDIQDAIDTADKFNRQLKENANELNTSEFNIKKQTPTSQNKESLKSSNTNIQEDIKNAVNQHLNENNAISDEIKHAVTENQSKTVSEDFKDRMNQTPSAQYIESMKLVNEGKIDEAISKARDVGDDNLVDYLKDYKTHSQEYARASIPPEENTAYESTREGEPTEVPEPRLAKVRTKDYADDTVTMRNILKRAQELFIPIRNGRVGKGIAGFTNHRTGIIRTKIRDDLDTITHELGHVIDAGLDLRHNGNEFDDEFGKVIHARFGGKYPEDKIRSEGIAEFTHDYMTDEAAAKRNFPNYYSEFKRAMDNNPDMAGRVSEVKSMIKKWQDQAPEARGRSAISYPDDYKNSIKDKAEKLKDEAITDWQDEAHYLNKGVSTVEKRLGRRLKDDENPAKLRQIANGAPDEANLLLTGNADEIKSVADKHGVKLNPTSVAEVLQDLKEASKGNDAVKKYLKDSGVKELHQGLDVYLTAQHLKEVYKHKYSDKVDIAKENLDSAKRAYDNAVKAEEDAKDTMRKNQQANKESIRSEENKSRYEKSQAQTALRMFTSDARDARDNLIKTQQKVEAAQKEVNKAQAIHDSIQKQREAIQSRKWNSVERKTNSEYQARLNERAKRATKTLIGKKEYLDTLKRELKTEQYKMANIQGILKDIGKAVDRRTVKMENKFLNKAQLKLRDSARESGKITEQNKGISTAKAYENMAKNEADRAADRLEKLQDNASKAKSNDAETSIALKQAKDDLADAQKRYNNATKMRIKYENRNYYRNADDIKTLEKAHATTTRTARQLRSAQTKYDNISKSTYQMPISMEDINHIINHAPKAFEDAAQGIYKVNDNFMRLAVKDGLIKKTTYDYLKTIYPRYVSLARDMLEGKDSIAPRQGGKGFINIGSAIKKLSEEGSKRAVISPLESLQRTGYAISDMIARNNVGKALADLSRYPKMGDIVEKVSGKASQNDNVFTVWRNGEKEAYQTTPEIYRTLQNVTPTGARNVLKLAQIPTWLLREGATLGVEFIAKNPARDIVMGRIVSRCGYIPIFDNIHGIMDMLGFGDEKIWNDYKASGAMHANFSDINRSVSQANIKGMYKTGAIDYIKMYNPVSMLRYFSDLMETSTRLGAFHRAIRNGYSLTEATLEARDISLDFSKHGKYGGEWNRIAAFFNAAIQDPFRLAQAIKDNPKRTIFWIGTVIGLPTIATWFNTHNPDGTEKQWYADRADWEKDTFWMFKTDGMDKPFRLPMPQMGTLFASPLRRTLDYLVGNNKNAYSGMLESMSGVLMPNIFPDALKQVLSQEANYDFFFDRNIVPQNLLKLPAPMQFDNSTSGVAKELGQVFGLSPKRIDYAINGLTGSIGREIVNSIDTLTGTKPFQNPFTKAFTVNTDYAPKPMQDFYDRLEEAQMAHNAQKQGQQISRDDQIKYGIFNSANNVMKDLNKQEKIAEAQGNTDRVQQITNQKASLARQALANYKAQGVK